jgi:periplasmic copper chaperone A
MSLPSPSPRAPRSPFHPLRRALAAMCLMGVCAQPAWADAVKTVPQAQAKAQPLVLVDKAWVRQAVPGQTATGGFMTLTASRDLTLVGFASPAAGETELHDMVMDGDVMRMRAMPSLTLPAGQPVVLRPGVGGQHLMLMGLKRPLKAGDELTLTLKLRTPDGKSLQQTVKVPVMAGAPKPAAAEPAASHHGH